MGLTESDVISVNDPVVTIARTRAALITAMLVVVAIAAGDVFDRTIWWLAAAPLMVGVVSIASIGLRWPIQALGATLGALGATALVVLANDGELGDIATSITAGSQRLLSTDWPSPDRADLIGTLAFGLGVITALGLLMVRKRAWHLSPLVPVIVAQTMVIALSAPMGLRLRWLLPLAILALTFATFRPADDTDVRGRLVTLRGERRLLPVSILSIALAVGLAIPLTLTNRADPRRTEPAERTAALLDPIEATLALRTLDPPVDLHAITITSNNADRQPTLWRTTALVEYDGGRWAPDLTLRPIGRRLESRGEQSIDATIAFLDPGLQLVPLPGAAVVVDAPIETDVERNIVRLVERPDANTVVSITARPEPAPSDVSAGQIATREIDENAAGLTDVATALAEQGGAATADGLLAQLEAIESTMSDDFVLRSDAAGGGLQRALIDRFVRDTQRGNAEQFVTAFVLLTRSLGADARVATGFEVEDGGYQTANGVTTAMLTSADAVIWPEVRVGNDWVAFDPVPASEASDAFEEQPDRQPQTPAAAQPPFPPPPESDDEPIVTEGADGDEAGANLPVIVTWAFRTAAFSGALLVPVLLAIGLILGIKWRRRRRQLSGAATDRIMGAWKVATSRLIDAGMTIPSAATNSQIANDATPLLAHGHREVRRLADLASATTFGSPARPDLLAADAEACLTAVETSLASARTPLDRLRWRLSLRSLRRKTSSPV